MGPLRSSFVASVNLSGFERMFPQVKGKYFYDCSLANLTFLGVGGQADLLFKPRDMDDLCFFLERLPLDIPVYYLGAGSNVLVRDAGMRGVVIQPRFRHVGVEGDWVTAGAGVFDVTVASLAQRHGLSGLEFLAGIPGTMGGAVTMNSGCYGGVISDVFVEALAVNRHGQPVRLSRKDVNFRYRSAELHGLCLVEVVLQGVRSSCDAVAQKMSHIRSRKKDEQPTGVRSCGSVFKNPPGTKARFLIQEAGCVGMKIGGAAVSEKQCNFILNDGSATATDVERLIDKVQAAVLRITGITLEPEVHILGEK